MTEESSLKLTELFQQINHVYARVLDCIQAEQNGEKTLELIQPLDDAAVVLAEMKVTLQSFRNGLIQPNQS